MSRRQHRRCCWSGTESRGHSVIVWLHMFMWMVNILNINFEQMTFWCIFVVLSIPVSVNLIDINVQSANVAWNELLLYVRHFTWHSSNKTNAWLEILTPSTFAFFCEVAHEKLREYVCICKSYSKKNRWHHVQSLIQLCARNLVWRYAFCEQYWTYIFHG